MGKTTDIYGSLAMAGLKILLRDVYSSFEVHAGDEMTAEMMSMSDQLISTRPKDQKCILRFVPNPRITQWRDSLAVKISAYADHTPGVLGKK